MPKKTLALIIGLVVVTVVLFVIALRTSKQQVNTPQTAMQPTSAPVPTSAAHSVLSLAPNPITVSPGGQGTVSVNIDTSTNDVTAVQLELAYDPTVISNVQVTPGPLFSNPVVLIDKNDSSTGRYTYAFGITPNHQTVNGTGEVATITFTALDVPGKSSQLALLPTTLVTAEGVATSVLKSATGTIVTVGAIGSQQAPNQSTTNTQTPPVVQTVPMTGAPIKTPQVNASPATP